MTDLSARARVSKGSRARVAFATRPPHFFAFRARRLALLVAAGALMGCASGGASPATSGPPMPAYEAEALSTTVPTRPLHILFSWTLQDGDARFSGRGATRVEPPLRARLDLFGPRGEGYLSAALVDMEMRLPSGAQDAPLPPPALLWAALGVFRAPVGAELVGSSRSGSTTRLEYARGQERWRFRLEDGALRGAEWVGPGDGRRTVEITGGAQYGLPSRAVYRDWLAFRELRLTLDEVNETDGFPADIWSIGRR